MLKFVVEQEKQIFCKSFCEFSIQKLFYFLDSEYSSVNNFTKSLDNLM